MKVVKGLVILVFCFLAAFAFSTAAGNFLGAEAEGSGGGLAAGHHSHPTAMSLQGKVEGVGSGDLGVKVGDENSCSSGVFFDHNYTGAIQDSLFNLLLGSQFDLNLNYNQDYYLCLYVEGELVDGPQQFRGGQGQIGIEDVNSAGFAKWNAAYDHILTTGESHTYINQDLRTQANPTFNVNTRIGTLTFPAGAINEDEDDIAFGDAYLHGIATVATANITASGDSNFSSLEADNVYSGNLYADKNAVIDESLAVSAINPSTAQDLKLWEGLSINNANTGQSLYVYRNAAEGKDYLRFYVADDRRATVYSPYRLLLKTDGTGYLRVGDGTSTAAWTSSDFYVYKNLRMRYDNKLIYFGTGYDATITYDGTDMIVDPRRVGVGNLIVTAGNLAVGTTAMQDKLTVDGNISSTKDINATGDIYYGGALVSYSPAVYCDAHSNKCLAIDFETQTQTWCNKTDGAWSCNVPNQSILEKLAKRDQFKQDAMEKEACLAQGAGWEMGEKGCRLNQEKECLAKEEYNYWDGSCKENLFLKCEYDPVRNWNGETQKCEPNPTKECEAQQDKAWQDGECVPSQEKQNQRLAAECLANKSKYWTGSECIEVSTLG